MTALTEDRNTPRENVSAVDTVWDFPATAAATYFQGGFGALDSATGRLVVGAVSLTLVAIGRLKAGKANALATDLIEVEQGVFAWANSGADAVPATQVGSDCFIEDDQTVSATDGTGTRSRAGIVRKIDADGVWVQSGLGL